MKDKSLILKKATRRKATRGSIWNNMSNNTSRCDSSPLPESEEWNDLTWNSISKQHIVDLLKHLSDKMGVKVETSTHGNIRFSDYLTEEQEQALLGDDNE